MQNWNLGPFLRRCWKQDKTLGKTLTKFCKPGHCHCIKLSAYFEAIHLSRWWAFTSLHLLGLFSRGFSKCSLLSSYSWSPLLSISFNQIKYIKVNQYKYQNCSASTVCLLLLFILEFSFFLPFNKLISAHSPFPPVLRPFLLWDPPSLSSPPLFTSKLRALYSIFPHSVWQFSPFRVGLIPS